MKLGFCFLVKNYISREHLWKKFFDAADDSQYSIYIHAKTVSVSTSLSRVSIDPDPIETEWASLSLVKATKRLLETAFNDECDAVIFLSGDSLPLWNFEVIQRLCFETLFTLQSEEGLNIKQLSQRNREFDRIKTYYNLDSAIKLVKQNMFFCMTKADYRLIMDIDVNLFPSREVPDEYFWANQLVIKGRNVENNN